jgi:hypothetical protein
MTFDKNEIIDKLKLELEVLEKGGYAPSVREPHREMRIFRDSVSCLNLGLEVKAEPCSDCYLMYFVPSEHRDKETPCHYIPLNKRGDTPASLGGTGDNEGLKDALRSWLQKTIFRMAEISELPRTSRVGRSCLLLPAEDRTSSSCSVMRRG